MTAVKEKEGFSASFIINEEGQNEYIVFPAKHFDQDLIEDISDTVIAKQKLESGSFVKL